MRGEKSARYEKRKGISIRHKKSDKDPSGKGLLLILGEKKGARKGKKNLADRHQEDINGLETKRPPCSLGRGRRAPSAFLENRSVALEKEGKGQTARRSWRTGGREARAPFGGKEVNSKGLRHNIEGGGARHV